ncbi:putative signaling protein [Pilimelia terevasa]|uniref:Putative signaling protein n=1 Tax=Pilimelia terevasa TaxID=53372 RepID=A0A8J3BD18_9ACTN|nr:bifunctional diguanylate cyclase/phosphodiesterase [Pilimelia terevasa]GGK12728.1 putative signaling protein [Pilimelia terevasa]
MGSSQGASAAAARASWAFAGGTGLALLAYCTGLPAVQLAVFVVISAGAIAAVVLGLRRYRLSPADARPWWYVVGAMSAFVVGSVLRQANPPGHQLTLAAFAPDLAVVPGYLLLLAGFGRLLARRRAAENDPARADAVLIGIGATLATWSLLIVPILAQAGDGAVLYVLGAAFPILDVVLLAMAAQLLFADGRREPVLWFVTFAAVSMLFGDLAFALRQIGRMPEAVTDLQIEVVFLAGFAAIGAAALHPSMVRLTIPHPAVLRRLGIGRVVGIAAVLLVPTVAASWVPPVNGADSLVRIGLTVILTVAILVRIVRAHDARIVAQQAAHEAELAERRRATHDPLTDLPNRELLTETLTRWSARAAADGAEISLLFLDLDRFKMVNDNWGHQVGDELLVAVAGRLSGMVRAEDLVCRIGGDEFVLALASHAPAKLAESLAARIVAEFARPFPLSVGDVVVTPSIGVVRAAGGTEALALLRDADIAMYQAKDAGRNSFALFDQKLRASTRHRVDLEQALRGALARGELSLHYQPIVDLQRGGLTGFEALLRWEHPVHGRVSPVDFIPIAEDTGLIVPIGDWILHEAAAQLQQWRQARPADAPELHVSVNVAVRQLRGDRLLDTVRRVLADTGLPASALWLEITESGAMEDLDSALATMRVLHGLGITICIDDFGTGYSSLSYLRMLPAEIVKIDRSFVQGMDEEDGDEAIVRTVVAMAHALGRRVVAEGVETEAQRDRLRALDCDLAQGYLFGAPRPPSADTAWLTLPTPAPVSAVSAAGAAHLPR